MPRLQDLGSRGNEAFLILFVCFLCWLCLCLIFSHCKSRCTTVFFSQNIGFSTVHLMSSVRNTCWLMIIDYYGGLWWSIYNHLSVNILIYDLYRCWWYIHIISYPLWDFISTSMFPVLQSSQVRPGELVVILGKARVSAHYFREVLISWVLGWVLGWVMSVGMVGSVGLILSALNRFWDFWDIVWACLSIAQHHLAVPRWAAESPLCCKASWEKSAALALLLCVAGLETKGIQGPWGQGPGPGGPL